MNQASTRSHCIFTIHLCSREPGSATLRRSKLHLVDLAGSERVGKTGVGGQILTEAKYINLSLHYLEQVRQHAAVFLMLSCRIVCVKLLNLKITTANQRQGKLENQQHNSTSKQKWVLYF